MTNKTSYKLLIASVFLTMSGLGLAQENHNDQADVWSTIEDQWGAEEKGDKKWIDRLLSEDFSGWPKNSPAPRSKASTTMWDRFRDDQGETVAHELYPLAIVVNGDVAIAHYFYSSAFKDTDDNVEVSNGRYTDILIRTEEGWKFIAWHGGDDEK
ncbi:MAG: nuclear transport factor 2 family protein [Gammaproteobacteria bacterium]|nr:nuclear transport factor 2 family protein [Gammaproteobacteria bacterium]